MKLQKFADKLDNIRSDAYGAANLSILSANCGVFYEGLFECLKQGTSLSIDEKIQVLLSAIDVYSLVRPKCSPEDQAADALGHFIFIECAELVLDSQFIQLDEDNASKRQFQLVLGEAVQKLASLSVAGPMFAMLQHIMNNQWNHPVLNAIMNGEELEAQTALNYLHKEEYPEVTKLRASMLVRDGCETLALHLCQSMLQSTLFSDDVSVLQMRLRLLYHLERLDEFKTNCGSYKCCTALDILKEMISKTQANEKQVILTTAQIFLLQDWMKPSKFCCTKELLTIWLQREHEQTREHQPFIDSVTKILLLAENTQQLTILLDAMVSRFDCKFRQLCTEIAVKAIRVDRYRLDSARTYTKDEKETDAAAASLAHICLVVASLYQTHFQMSVASLVAALYLEATPGNFFILKKAFSDMQGRPGSSPQAPGDVQDELYEELHEMVMTLRPAKFDPQLGFEALSKVALLHLEEAGYRYNEHTSTFSNLLYKRAHTKENSLSNISHVANVKNVGDRSGVQTFVKTDKSNPDNGMSKKQAVKWQIKQPSQYVSQKIPMVVSKKVTPAPKPPSAGVIIPDVSRLSVASPSPQSQHSKPTLTVQLPQSSHLKVTTPDAPKVQPVRTVEPTQPAKATPLLSTSQQRVKPQLQSPSPSLHNVTLDEIQQVICGPSSQSGAPVDAGALKHITDFLHDGISSSSPILHKVEVNAPQPHTAQHVQKKVVNVGAKANLISHQQTAQVMPIQAVNPCKTTIRVQTLQAFPVRDNKVRVEKATKSGVGSLSANNSGVRVLGATSSGVSSFGATSHDRGSLSGNGSRNGSMSFTNRNAGSVNAMTVSQASMASKKIVYSMQNRNMGVTSSATTNSQLQALLSVGTHTQVQRPTNINQKLMGAVKPVVVKTGADHHYPLQHVTQKPIKTQPQALQLTHSPQAISSQTSISLHLANQNRVQTPAPSNIGVVGGVVGVLGQVNTGIPTVLLAQEVAVPGQHNPLASAIVSADYVGSFLNTTPLVQTSVHTPPTYIQVAASTVAPSTVPSATQPQVMSRSDIIQAVQNYLANHSVAAQPVSVPTPQVSVQTESRVLPAVTDYAPSSGVSLGTVNSTEMKPSASILPSPRMATRPVYHPLESSSMPVEAATANGTCYPSQEYKQYQGHSHTAYVSQAVVSKPVVSHIQYPLSSQVRTVSSSPSPSNSSLAMRSQQNVLKKSSVEVNVNASVKGPNRIMTEEKGASTKMTSSCSIPKSTINSPPQQQQQPTALPVTPDPESSQKAQLPKPSLSAVPNDKASVTNPTPEEHTTSKEVNDFSCKYCHKEFENLAKRLRHQEWLCKMKEGFTEAATQPKEKRSSEESNDTDSHLEMFYCDVCSKEFPDESCLQSHISKIHTIRASSDLNSPHSHAGLHVCELCGKGMDTKRGRNAHMLRVHGFIFEAEEINVGVSVNRSNRREFRASMSDAEENTESPHKNSAVQSMEVSDCNNKKPLHKELSALNITPKESPIKKQDAEQIPASDAHMAAKQNPITAALLASQPKAKAIEEEVKCKEEANSENMSESVSLSDRDDSYILTDSTDTDEMLPRRVLRSHGSSRGVSRDSPGAESLLMYELPSGIELKPCSVQLERVSETSSVDKSPRAKVLAPRTEDGETSQDPPITICDKCGQFSTMLQLVHHTCDILSSPEKQKQRDEIKVEKEVEKEDDLLLKASTPITTPSALSPNVPQTTLAHNKDTLTLATLNNGIPMYVKTKFMCAQCFKAFVNRRDLEIHQEKENHPKVIEYPVYQCTKCRASYQTKLSLQKHVLKNCKECIISDEHLPSTESAEEGKKQVVIPCETKKTVVSVSTDDDKRYCCPKCPRQFGSMVAVRTHVARSHSANPSKESNTNSPIKLPGKPDRNSAQQLNAASSLIRLSEEPLDTVNTDDFDDLVQFVAETAATEMKGPTPNLDPVIVHKEDVIDEGSHSPFTQLLQTPLQPHDILSWNDIVPACSESQSVMPSVPPVKFSPQSISEVAPTNKSIKLTFYKNVSMIPRKIIKCKICSKLLSTKAKFKNHMEEKCGLDFPQVNLLGYACPYCLTVFRCRKSCREHQIATCLPKMGFDTSELSVPRLACPKCDCKVFASPDLTCHLKMKHKLSKSEVGVYMAQLVEGGVVDDYGQPQVPSKHTHEISQAIDAAIPPPTSEVNQVQPISRLATICRTYHSWLTAQKRMEESCGKTGNCGTSHQNVKMCSVGTFKCSACDETFTCFSLATQHKTKQACVKGSDEAINITRKCHYTCPYCQEKFQARGKCRTHLLAKCLVEAGLDPKEYEQPVLPCPLSSKCINQWGAKTLIQHLRIRHKLDKAECVKFIETLMSLCKAAPVIPQVAHILQSLSSLFSPAWSEGLKALLNGAASVSVREILVKNDILLCLSLKQCKTCGQVFDRPGINDHWASSKSCSGGEVTPWVRYFCPYCSCHYNTRSNCSVHIDSCEGRPAESNGIPEQKIACSGCEKKFYTQIGVESHFRKCSGAKHGIQLSSLRGSEDVEMVDGTPEEDVEMMEDDSATVEENPTNNSAVHPFVLHKNILMLYDYQCQCCMAQFVSKEELEDHHRTVCLERKEPRYICRYSCPFCFFAFPNKAECREHQLHVCLEEKGYDTKVVRCPQIQCPVTECHKRVYDGICLEKHLKGHSMEQSDVKEVIYQMQEMGILGSNMEALVWENVADDEADYEDDDDDDGDDDGVHGDGKISQVEAPMDVIQEEVSGQPEIVEDSPDGSNAHLGTKEQQLEVLSTPDVPADHESKSNDDDGGDLDRSADSLESSSASMLPPPDEATPDASIAKPALKSSVYNNVSMLMKTMWRCSECKQLMEGKIAIQSHRKGPCGKAFKLIRYMLFYCPFCSQEFEHKKHCFEHQTSLCLKESGVDVVKLVTPRIQCPMCEIKVFDLLRLCSHLHNVHKLPYVEVKNVMKSFKTQKKQVSDKKSQEPDRKSQEHDRKSQEHDRKSQEHDSKSLKPDRKSQKPDRKSQKPDRKSQVPDSPIKIKTEVNCRPKYPQTFGEDAVKLVNPDDPTLVDIKKRGLEMAYHNVIIIRHEIQHFNCCSYDFVSKSYFYICSLCNEQFKTSQLCRDHIMKTCFRKHGRDPAHLKQPRVFCPLCSKVFFDVSILKSHFSKLHSIPKSTLKEILKEMGLLRIDEWLKMQQLCFASVDPIAAGLLFRCPCCPAVAVNYKLAVYHRQYLCQGSNGGVKKFVDHVLEKGVCRCDKCEKEFKHPLALLFHEYNHTELDSNADDLIGHAEEHLSSGSDPSHVINGNIPREIMQDESIPGSNGLDVNFSSPEHLDVSHQDLSTETTAQHDKSDDGLISMEDREGSVSSPVNLSKVTESNDYPSHTTSTCVQAEDKDSEQIENTLVDDSFTGSGSTVFDNPDQIYPIENGTVNPNNTVDEISDESKLRKLEYHPEMPFQASASLKETLSVTLQAKICEIFNNDLLQNSHSDKSLSSTAILTDDKPPKLVEEGLLSSGPPDSTYQGRAVGELLNSFKGTEEPSGSDDVVPMVTDNKQILEDEVQIAESAKQMDGKQDLVLNECEDVKTTAKQIPDEKGGLLHKASSEVTRPAVSSQPASAKSSTPFTPTTSEKLCSSVMGMPGDVNPPKEVLDTPIELISPAVVTSVAVDDEISFTLKEDSLGVQAAATGKIMKLRRASSDSVDSTASNRSLRQTPHRRAAAAEKRRHSSASCVRAEEMESLQEGVVATVQSEGEPIPNKTLKFDLRCAVETPLTVAVSPAPASERVLPHASKKRKTYEKSQKVDVEQILPPSCKRVVKEKRANACFCCRDSEVNDAKSMDCSQGLNDGKSETKPGMPHSPRMVCSSKTQSMKEDSKGNKPASVKKQRKPAHANTGSSGKQTRSKSNEKTTKEGKTSKSNPASKSSQLGSSLDDVDACPKRSRQPSGSSSTSNDSRQVASQSKSIGTRSRAADVSKRGQTPTKRNMSEISKVLADENGPDETISKSESGKRECPFNTRFSSKRLRSSLSDNSSPGHQAPHHTRRKTVH